MKKESRTFSKMLLAMAGLCMCCASISFAATPDVFDGAYPILLQTPQCVNDAATFFADIDKNGKFEIMVAVAVVNGEGQLYSSSTPGEGYTYTFSYVDCSGDANTPTGPGQLSIRFVDALDPSFDWQNSTTWKFKSIQSVSIDGTPESGLICPRIDPATGNYVTNPYFRIKAYKDFNQVGEITGTTATVKTVWTRYAFVDPAGIKELYIHTDFCENELNNLFLNNIVTPFILTDPSDEVRMHGGTATLTVVAQGPGTLSYQWYKDGSPLKNTKGALTGYHHAILGALTATLKIYNLIDTDTGNYYVVVTNQNGSTTSKTARIDVLSRAKKQIPKLIEQPTPNP